MLQRKIKYKIYQRKYTQRADKKNAYNTEK